MDLVGSLGLSRTNLELCVVSPPPGVVECNGVRVRTLFCALLAGLSVADVDSAPGLDGSSGFSLGVPLNLSTRSLNEVCRFLATPDKLGDDFAAFKGELLPEVGEGL